MCDLVWRGEKRICWSWSSINCTPPLVEPLAVSKWYRMISCGRRGVNRAALMTACPKKSNSVFYILVTKLFLVCLLAPDGTHENFCYLSLWWLNSHLSDAGCLTCWRGVVGEVVSRCGSGVAGSLLQLLSQLGHLRATWREKCIQRLSGFILRRGRWPSFPSGGRLPPGRHRRVE